MPSEYSSLLSTVRHRLRAPVGVVLGAPRTAAEIASRLSTFDAACFQFDRYQADRLEDALAEAKVLARVEVAPDLWDLAERFASIVFLSPARGERELKLDVVEQAFHALQDKGLFCVLSPVAKDQLFPAAMKKVFGNVALETDREGTVLWSRREGERKRRRHEITFSAKVGERDYREFISRPGVFAYGRLDDGSRSLLDVLESQPGERIVELGCGSGAVGIVAALRAGADASLTLADSSARAVAVARENVRRHGLANAEMLLTTDFGSLRGGLYDLALANPPYYAHHAVTQLFIEQAYAMLRRGGRLYLVTKQVDPVEPMVEEIFGPMTMMVRREYAILVATRRGH